MADIHFKAQYRIGGLFSRWHRFRHVVGDGFIDGQQVRYFVLACGTTIYFPVNAEVRFSPERQSAILQKMRSEAGQPVTMR
ncbi:MAG: hypothetical protein KJ804_06645 [Proteobacteria bacterium]|nr:hypothetical protein [Pseudomonadota bacterium]MBU1057980.1 hypothetical protein [Pseudomonadota bacterium]